MKFKNVLEIKIFAVASFKFRIKIGHSCALGQPPKK